MIKNSAQFLQVFVYYTHKNMYLMSTNLAASYKKIIQRDRSYMEHVRWTNDK